MAAFLAVPLLIGAGLAMDYATVSRVNHELQGALDTAALAVAREGKTMTDARAQQVVSQFVSANFNGTVEGVTVNRGPYSVQVSATVSPALAFSGLLGKDMWQVTNDSTAEFAPARFEIALALDQTGSMAGAKLAAMKDAVNTMVDAMSLQVTDPSALKVGVVPYATFVNVGPQYGPKFDGKGRVIKGTGAEWLDLKGKSDVPQLELPQNLSRFEVMHHLKQEWKGCVETRMPTKKVAYDVADVPAVQSKKKSLFVPTFAIDEPDTGEYGNNYIASNVDPLDKGAIAQVQKLLKYGLSGVVGPLGLDGLVQTNPATNFSGSKGPGNGCVAQPITPLTNQYGSLKSKVGSLEARGNTNIMEGVAWGMRVLSPGEPFNEGRKDEPGVEKIMIVLTDGSNVFGNRSTKLGSTYSSFGYLVDGRIGVTSGGSSNTTNIMNQKTLAACDNAKAAGIEVYTIRLEEPDVATGSMLADCATSAAHYFDTPSRTDLDKVFSKIRENIVKLRISS